MGARYKLRVENESHLRGTFLTGLTPVEKDTPEENSFSDQKVLANPPKYPLKRRESIQKNLKCNPEIRAEKIKIHPTTNAS
jgi:hypothetical protein